MPKYRVQEFKRGQAKALRQLSTDAEARLWRLLRSRQRLIVEADGSQHSENQYDKIRDTDLRQRGFRILRFWNNDIIFRTNSVLEAILTEIAKAPSPGALRAPPSPTRGEG